MFHITRGYSFIIYSYECLNAPCSKRFVSTPRRCFLNDLKSTESGESLKRTVEKRTMENVTCRFENPIKGISKQFVTTGGERGGGYWYQWKAFASRDDRIEGENRREETINQTLLRQYWMSGKARGTLSLAEYEALLVDADSTRTDRWTIENNPVFARRFGPARIARLPRS